LAETDECPRGDCSAGTHQIEMKPTAPPIELGRGPFF